MKSLGVPDHSLYRFLLRDVSDQEDWLSLSKTLAKPGVAAGMILFVLDPPKPDFGVSDPEILSQPAP
jgi:hypothetical protein